MAVVGKIDSPWLAPVPGTYVNENAAVWSALLESKIVQVAPLVMSIEPGKAVARKYAGVVLIVAEVLLGLTTIEVTPVSTTETDVDPLQAAQLPADAVIVADPV